MQSGAPDEFAHRLAGLEHPVADQCRAERDHCSALKAHHGIDPFAHPGTLLEVARIHEIHAAGPCDLSVYHHDFSVQTKIGTTYQRSQQPSGQR